MSAPKQSASERAFVTPLLISLAVPRSDQEHLPGSYDPNSQVWVVKTQNGLRPLIEAAPRLSELSTKTKVIQEQDDISATALLETVTKTYKQLERDDAVDGLPFALLELSTKTEVSPERDDR